jgi:DNA primase large subunit
VTPPGSARNPTRGKKAPEMETLIQAELDKHLRTVDPYSGKAADEGALAKDEVSHFALRLAYCRTEELRRWFLMQECALFRHRWGGGCTS